MMANRVTVAEEENSFGQQVFVFSLPNGRRLRLDFCPLIMHPDADACYALAILQDQDCNRVPLVVVDDGGTKTQTMQAAKLWFSTPEEEERYGQMLIQELDVMQGELKPIIKAINEHERHKDN